MPELPTVTLRRAAASMRSLANDVCTDLATNSYWACDLEATEDEIYAHGTDSGLGGAAGTFAAAWTPGVALAVADLLDAVAAKAEELRGILGVWSFPVSDPQWDAALKTARAFLSREERADA